MPVKTVMNSYMRQQFVALKSLSHSAEIVLNSSAFKSRLPEGLTFWIEDYDNKKYFLGAEANNKILSWAESKSLWEYLIDTFDSELLQSEKIMSKTKLMDFIYAAKDLNKNEETFYIRNIKEFLYKDLEQNVHQITIYGTEEETEDGNWAFKRYKRFY